MLRIVAASLCAAALCGCAAADTESAPKPEKQYRTGSNIPRRDGAVADGVETSTVSTGDTRLGTPSVPRPSPSGGR